MKSIFTILFAQLFFVVNAGTITWTGQNDNRWGLATNWTPIQVPTSSDSVIINMDSVIIDVPLAKARTIVLSGSNTALTIEKESKLSVGPSSGYGIELLLGTALYNYGMLVCDDTMQDGIHAIANTVLQNHGYLEVTNSMDIGIRALGQFTNFVSADILIINCVSGLSASMFENNGSVKIEDMDDIGITGNGLVNNGLIDVRNINNCNNCYAFFSNSFTNNVSATISISKVNGHGLFTGGETANYGIITIDSINGGRGIFASTGAMSNLGTLTISNIYSALGTGITNIGNFINAGPLVINGAKNIGIEVDGNFTNDAAGIITISSGNEIKTNRGIWVKDTLINLGNIFITDSTTSGFQQVFDLDSEVLTINTGLISINSSANALEIEAGNFNNGGNVTINACNHGVVLSNAVLINTSLSELTVNVFEKGLELMDQSSLIIQNNSMCMVTSAVGNPLSVELGSMLDIEGEIDAN